MCFHDHTLFHNNESFFNFTAQSTFSARQSSAVPLTLWQHFPYLAFNRDKGHFWHEQIGLSELVSSYNRSINKAILWVNNYLLQLSFFLYDITCPWTFPLGIISTNTPKKTQFKQINFVNPVRIILKIQAAMVETVAGTSCTWERAVWICFLDETHICLF